MSNFVIVSFCNNPNSTASPILCVKLQPSESESISYAPVNLGFPGLIHHVTGLTLTGNIMLAAFSSEGRFYVAGLNRKDLAPLFYKELPGAKDVHSILAVNDHLYVVSTGTDEVLCYDIKEQSIENPRIIWRASDTKSDTHHINSIAEKNGEILVSAFGPKAGQLWSTALNGYILNITTGSLVMDKIYHPHSLSIKNGRIYYSDSHRNTFCVIDQPDAIFDLPGYTRGVSWLTDNLVCVATSIGRRVSKSTGLIANPADPGEPSGECGILIGDVFEKRTIKKIDLSWFGPEIYDVLALNDIAVDLLVLSNTSQMAERRAVQILFQQLSEKNQQLTEINQQLTEISQQIQDLSTQIARKEQEIQEIYRSKAWRMVLFLRKIRVFLIPSGSRREVWVQSSLRVAAYIRQNGLGRFLERAIKYLKEPTSMNLTSNKEQFSFLLSDGTICSMPAISIIIERPSDYEQLQFTEMDLIDWLETQTFNDAEIVVWDREENLATMVSKNEISWAAKDMETLCQNLAGKYICMASPDLLERNHTYLEANLLALETEDLIFTINLIGKSYNLLENIGDGNLPSNCDSPYQRQFIRRDCIRNDFIIDVSKYLDGRENQPVVVGKIIEHISSVSDTITMIPANIDLTINTEWTLDGHYVIAKNKNEISWERIGHTIHPVNTVLPFNKDVSHLPTVLVFMPFLAVGGAEKLMLKLIQELKDRIRFIVVTVEKTDATLGTMTDLFFKEIPHVYTLADYLQPRLYFFFLSYLIEKFEVQSFYIANGSNWIYDHLLMLRQKYPPLRIVNQVYDHQFGWINKYNNKIADAIDAHISANPKISHAYLRYDVQPERIHFIEHAVDINEINPDDYPSSRCIEIKNKLGLPVDKKIVVFCARLHPQKRPLDFIEIARRLSSEELIHFLMVGDGPLTLAVEEQVKRTGLRNLTRIPFYFPVSDIYAIADVFVLTSEYEAMPLVVLEALAMGKPVVATDVGHIRDVLEMTKGGTVISSISDISAFCTGILRSLEENFDTALMRYEISRRFGLSVISKKYFAVWLGEQDA